MGYRLWKWLEPGDLITEVTNGEQLSSWGIIISVGISKFGQYLDVKLVNLTYLKIHFLKKSHMESLPSTILVVRNGQIIEGKSLPTVEYRPYAP